MKFCYRKIFHENETMLAISDYSLVGKSFYEDEICIHISKDFYHEKECGEAEAVKMAKTCTIVNAVGKDIVSLLLNENLIEKKSILTIKGIPHAQIIHM